MEPSQAELADYLNGLAAGDRVSVTEAAEGIAVYQLTGAEAESLLARLGEAGWTEPAAWDAGGEIARDLVAKTAAGIRVTATRPAIPADVDAVLTSAAFAALLKRPIRKPVVWVEGLTAIVDTLTVRYAPWGTADAFAPQEDTANPARVVRVLGGDGPGDQLGRWILRSSGTAVGDAALAPWRILAATRLLVALAQEIEADGALLFRGPPPTRFVQTNADHIDAIGFVRLQGVAAWVYENERELENRHGLAAAEIARTSLRNGTLADLAATLGATLEGAKIAYNFGVTQQSRDTLKALGDLRKAVSDDAAKLSETTRMLAGAIIGAVFGNIGLIVARLTLPSNGVYIGPAAKLLASVLAIYVLAMVASGCHYIAIQHSLRNDWRDRLYKFLGDDEYKRMVERPAKRAARAFWLFAAVGLVMTAMTTAAAWRIAGAPPVAAAGNTANAAGASNEAAAPPAARSEAGHRPATANETAPAPGNIVANGER
jgi:hypothetical protein